MYFACVWSVAVAFEFETRAKQNSQPTPTRAGARERGGAIDVRDHRKPTTESDKSVYVAGEATIEHTL